MFKCLLVTFCAVLGVVTSDPYIYGAPLVASPYASAAYVSPAASVFAAPFTQAVSPFSGAVSALPAAVPAVPAVPTVPAAVPASVPFSSVSAYSYGSSYSIQDYLPTVVNPAATSLAYSLPYAYAADYFYRR